MLEQFENEVRPFNWSNMLDLQLEGHVPNAQSPPKDEKAQFFMFVYLVDAICAQE